MLRPVGMTIELLYQMSEIFVYSDYNNSLNKS